MHGTIAPMPILRFWPYSVSVGQWLDSLLQTQVPLPPYATLRMRVPLCTLL